MILFPGRKRIKASFHRAADLLLATGFPPGDESVFFEEEW